MTTFPRIIILVNAYQSEKRRLYRQYPISVKKEDKFTPRQFDLR